MEDNVEKNTKYHEEEVKQFSISYVTPDSSIARTEGTKMRNWLSLFETKTKLVEARSPDDAIHSLVKENPSLSEAFILNVKENGVEV